MSRSVAPQLFLSYARGDAERNPFVSVLHAALKHAGFRVWWDQTDMPGRGLTFHQEIRDAIERCNRLVLLVGSKALQSDYVRAEWQYALAAGKVVNPVLLTGTHKLLPGELKNLECPVAGGRRTGRAAIAHLLRLLSQPLAPLGTLKGPIPEPPPHFQPRVDEISMLADRALPDTRHRGAPKPAERITVVHGMPGAGKSALVAAFGRSTETRRAFHDGVIWIPVGQSASVSRVVQLAAEAAGGVGARIRRRENDDIRLRNALEGKACLIILDDVWSLDHVLPFSDALGRRSRLVLTTRIAGLQSSLGSAALLIGAVDEQTALRLLADWSGEPVDGLPPAATEVARECGYLPFALALCGAMAQTGLPWADLLANLASANLAFLEKRVGKYPYSNLLRPMAASLAHLAREQVRCGRDHDPNSARRVQEWTRW